MNLPAKIDLDEFCGHIANGGGVPEWCAARGLTYSNVMAWVNMMPERVEMYEQAKKDREQWYMQAILDELKKVGLADIGQAYDENGCLKQMNDIPPALRSAIVAVETDEIKEWDAETKSYIHIGTTKRVKFSDKLKALELLGKNLQMFIDQSRLLVAGRFSLEDLIDQSREVDSGKRSQVESREKRIEADPGSGSSPVPAVAEASKLEGSD